MATTPGATPKKTFDFFSSSDDDVSIVCGMGVKES